MKELAEVLGQIIGDTGHPPELERWPSPIETQYHDAEIHLVRLAEGGWRAYGGPSHRNGYGDTPTSAVVHFIRAHQR